MKHFTIVLLGSLFFISQSFAQNFSLAKSMGGTSSSEEGRAIFTDALGNIYTTGSFQGTADFDPGIGTSNLVSAGGTEVFISKLGSTGNLVWAKKIGSTSSDIGTGITVDGNGNVYVTGFFNGTVDFDPGTGTTNLSSAGASDAFVLKLNSVGNFVWAKKIGGTNTEQSTSIALDKTGNILIGGNFSSNNCDFDPGAGTSTASPIGGNDAFLVKLDANGNFIWAKQMGGTAGEGVYALTTDASNNVYSTGWFQGTVDFDPSVSSFTLTSDGGVNNDVFVSKLDSNGTFLWAKQMGGSLADEGNAIKVDKNGNVYTTGNFQGTADFNPGIGTDTLASAGNRDLFVSKLDANGNFVWAKNMGGTAHDFSYGIDVDSSGNVYTTGSFQGTADFDPGASTYNLISGGSLDIFLSKLNSNGNFVWATKIGNSSSDVGKALTLNASGEIYVTGYFSATVDFDPGSGTANLTSAGAWDIFVLHLSQCPSTSATVNPSVCSSYTSPSGIYTWTTSGTYTDIIPNSVGCDSIITVNLTIKNTSSVITNTSCVSYTAPGGIKTWTVSGTYLDTIPNAGGCDSIITIHLTIPVISTIVTQNGTVLTAQATGVSYQWINCAGNIAISGATSQTYTATANGNYAVIITKNGCSDTSSCSSINSVGIREIADKSAASMAYPNPSSGTFIIEAKQQIKAIIITDILGNTLVAFTPENVFFEIDMSQVASGVYFAAVLFEEDKKEIIKLIKR